MSESDNKAVKAVYEAALKLSAAERELLVAMLEQGSPCEDDWFATPEVAQAWNEEIARRIKAIDEGKMLLIPAEEVHRRLRKILVQ